MSKIIVPTNYDTVIEIKYASLTGQSELQIKKGSLINNALMVAGILLEHASTLVKKTLTYKPPQPNSNTNGGDTNG